MLSSNDPKFRSIVKSYSSRATRKATNVVRQYRTKRMSVNFDNLMRREEYEFRKNRERSFGITHDSNHALLNPYRTFKMQYSKLLNAFPDFPTKMMKTLVIREQGNLKSVYKFLISNGWKCSCKRLSFKDEKLFHITMKHFWGEDRPYYINTLDTKKIGSYFYVIKDCEYYIYYKDSIGIQKQKISNPLISVKLYFKNESYFPLSRSNRVSDEDLLFF